MIQVLINRAKSGDHFVDVKQSSFRHLLIWQTFSVTRMISLI